MFFICYFYILQGLTTVKGQQNRRKSKLTGLHTLNMLRVWLSINAKVEFPHL